jgi:hypothetical protein
MMRAEEILGVTGLRFVEPSFADLPDEAYTDMLVGSPGDEGRMLVDEQEDPVALAIGGNGSWAAGSFHLRSFDLRAVDRFEETNGEILQEDRAVWASAVREYYSHSLMRDTIPSIEDVNPDRPGMVSDLLAEYWGDVAPAVCYDYCCGSGIGSMVLRQKGFFPLSFDNDPTLLALGLAKGRLLPEETMLFDATRAQWYLSPASLGLGLMFGEINSFSEPLWKEITDALLSLATTCLITTGTEPEARLVEKWAGERKRPVTVTENERDPIYDRWVCRIG